MNEIRITHEDKNADKKEIKRILSLSREAAGLIILVDGKKSFLVLTNEKGEPYASIDAEWAFNAMVDFQK